MRFNRCAGGTQLATFDDADVFRKGVTSARRVASRSVLAEVGPIIAVQPRTSIVRSLSAKLFDANPHQPLDLAGREGLVTLNPLQAFRRHAISCSGPSRILLSLVRCVRKSP